MQTNGENIQVTQTLLSQETPVSLEPPVEELVDFHPPLPIISISELKLFGKDQDLFAALDKSSVELLVTRNHNERGCPDIPLAITNFKSSLDNIKTAELLEDYLRLRGIVFKTPAPGMFYKCYHSVGFRKVSINVKLYFSPDGIPTIEFRKINGCDDIFFDIYVTFRNLILNENKSLGLTPPIFDLDLEIEPISHEEEAAGINNLIRSLKSCPEDNIEDASKFAMGKPIDKQIVICNEVYNVLLKLKPEKFSNLLAQTMGFVDLIGGPTCLLEDGHKRLIFTRLKTMIERVIGFPNIQDSVRIRAQRFLDEPQV